MVRPRNETNMIVARVGGAFLFWQDGVFAGDNEELLADVRLAARTGVTMLLTVDGPALDADGDNPLGAVAALLAAKPGRVEILEAPASVWNLYPERIDSDPLLIVDGLEENNHVTEYTTDQERGAFGLNADDERVKTLYV